MILAQSAEVTNLPERAVLVLIFIATVCLAVWGMRRAWLGKQAKQSFIDAPADLPSGFVSEHAVEGRYLAASLTGDWLSRVVVHGLGIPSRCTLAWNRDGIAVQRPTSTSFFVPWADVISVRPDRAIAGRAFERDGIAVITIQVGANRLDFGFRADVTQGHLQVLSIQMKQESGA